MASSCLKKMLFFIIFNTDGVRVLVCPAIFGTLDGLCDKCLNHQASVMPIYWLMFANVVFLHMEDVIAMLFVADVIATVMYFYWQILLPYFVG